MSLERDLQSDLAITVLTAITIDSEAAQQGDTVDTFGFRNLTFAYWFGTDLADGDVVELGAQESDDGVTWTACDDDQLLPYRRSQDDDMALVNPANGYIQTMGVISAARYVRPTVNCTALASQSITLNIGAIMVPEIREFTAWDPDVASDGNP